MTKNSDKNDAVVKKDEGFDIIIGDFIFDFFQTDSGTLGFTVANKNDGYNGPSVDIFVEKDLTVYH